MVRVRLRISIKKSLNEGRSTYKLYRNKVQMLVMSTIAGGCQVPVGHCSQNFYIN